MSFVMLKRHIVDNARAGLRVLGPHVARIRRGTKGRVLVMRHAWTDRDDGRASHAAWEAARRWAQNLANEKFATVEIYAHDGSLLAQVEPETVS